MSDFTTTTNLSLKKPAIGGSSDKWGEYLNENMETIGTSIVNLQNASTSRSLESLTNVLDATPTTGQLLQYDTAQWKAATVTIPDNIQDLTNVTISDAADGQVLAYSTSNSRWENQTPGAATIPDGTITTAKLSTSLQGQVALILQTTGAPTDNQILRYDSTSTNWQFEDLPGGTVSALSDTDVSSISNKDVLVYNSTSGDWVSRPLVISDITNLQTSLDAKLESSDISVSALSDTTITSTADDSFLVYDSSDSKWKNEGPSTVRSTLDLVVGTNVQAFDQGLQSIAGLTTVANKMLYTTASDTYGVADLTAAGRAILDDADAAAQRTTLGLGFFATRSIALGLTSIGGFPPTAEFIRYVTFNDDQVSFNKIDLNDQYNFENSLAVSLGGTGGTTASAARTNLGLGTLATQDTITESQISDLQSYLTAESNDLSSVVTWANVPDANITETSVTQHQTALSITESQISDLQTYLTESSTATLTNKSGNISQWTNDSGYLTAETNNLSTVSGTLGTANGGTGVTALSSLNAADLGSNNGVSNATDGYVLTADGTGGVAWEAATGGISDIVSDTTPQLGGNLDVNGQSIVSVSAGDISITPDSTGQIILDGLSWPTADGNANQVLKTDGAGNLSFVDQSGGGGITTGKAIAMAIVFG
tara:strand:- start:455 stop:2416 length:1962 start_codon:yes stop_codon:yes gene_type:complete